MASYELVGVPYTSMARPGGIADAIAVLRGAGLAPELAAFGVQDGGDLDLALGNGERAPSGLLNEEALGHLLAATRAGADQVFDRRRRPLLVGGDCPVLLGALAAGRDRGEDVALLFVDGHEDCWPPPLSPTGEASDSEIAIALGRVNGLTAPLDALVPLIGPESIAMLGPRDRAEIERGGAESVAGEVALFCDDAGVRRQGGQPVAAQAIACLADRSSAFWLHLDLDVLMTEHLRAVDYRQDGGLGWDELLEITRTALGEPRCLGASVVIYNPDLDPERTDAARIVRFLADAVSG